MRLGVLGGTFDPIHQAHLFIAEAVRVAVGLDRVLFVPNRSPAHKPDAEVAPAEERMLMVRLAIAGNPCFECSDVELRREGPSYTVDTLKQLLVVYPGADLHFIMGLDTILEITSWREPDEVVRLARLVVVARPGYRPGDLPLRVPARYLERTTVVPTPAFDLSSTAIRERVRQSQPIRYLTPDPVAAHIEAAGLYR